MTGQSLHGSTEQYGTVQSSTVQYRGRVKCVEVGLGVCIEHENPAMGELE